MNKKNIPQEKQELRAKFAFGKENYRIMLIGILLIVLGFLLMTGMQSLAHVDSLSLLFLFLLVL